jgi:hypothetical protein
MQRLDNEIRCLVLAGPLAYYGIKLAENVLQIGHNVAPWAVCFGLKHGARSIVPNSAFRCRTSFNAAHPDQQAAPLH